MAVNINIVELSKLLQQINHGRYEYMLSEGYRTAEEIAESLFGSSSHLAVYGTLSPGEVNESVLQSMQGQWQKGYVRGRLFQPGSWGEGIEYPGLKWVPEGERIAVRVFESTDLLAEWERLDVFEGEEYLRILVPVEFETGAIQIANLYAIRN